MNKLEKQVLRFSKKALIFVFAHITIFAIAMIVIYCVKGSVPETLIIEHYKYFSLESGALGIIKISENIIDKLTNRKEKRYEQSEE